MNRAISLHGLERDVAAPVRHHNVHNAGEDLVAFDEAGVVDRHRSELSMGLRISSVPLMSSSPMLSRPTRG